MMKEMTMKNMVRFCFACALTCLVLFGRLEAQTEKRSVTALPLCQALEQVSTGTHKEVVVFAIYEAGEESSFLYDPNCHEGERSTWVKFALKSKAHDKELDDLLARSRPRRAYVQVAGELYGPPSPDPKLPEAIRRKYQPGWGHLSAYRYQLVVRAIHSVRPVPESTPSWKWGTSSDARSGVPKTE
jgi:hypothetical protein